MDKREGPDAKPDTGGRYSLTRKVNPAIPKAVLQPHPILRDLMVIRAPTGTSFAVSEEEWAALQELIGDPPVHDYVEPALDEIVSAILAQGLRVAERTIRRLHFSLKTRGFVI